MGVVTPVTLLVGVILILVAVALFFLDKFKPGYKRDSDTVYSILFLTVGIFSLVNFSAGPAESFQLLLCAGMLIALMIENIQRRTPSNASLYQGGGNTSGSGGGSRKPDRPSRSSRSGFEDDYRSEVRAEFDDEVIPMEESSRVRRIRGGREGASTRDNYQSAYLDQLSEDTREPRRAQNSGIRRPSSAYSDDDSQQYGGGEEPRTRRRKQPLQLEGDAAIASTSDNSGYSYGEERPAKVETSASGRRRGRSESSLSSSSLPESEVPASGSSRSARRRSRGNGGDRPLDGGDYVDYKPLGTPKPTSSDDDFDNSGNFDDNPGSFR